MTILAMKSPASPRLPFPLFVLLALALLAGAFLFNSLAHAQNKHPLDQDQVRECLKNGGAAWFGYNRALNRYAFVCKMDDGAIGFRALGIDENGRWYQATSFIRHSASTTGDVISYLQNAGYFRCTTGIVSLGINGTPAQIYAALITAEIIIP